MGITVVSTASATPLPGNQGISASPASGELSDPGQAIDFAALFAQVANATQMNPADLQKAAPALDTVDSEERALSDSEMELSPEALAQAMQNALPFLPPPSPPATMSNSAKPDPLDASLINSDQRRTASANELAGLMTAQDNRPTNQTASTGAQDNPLLASKPPLADGKMPMQPADLLHQQTGKSSPQGPGVLSLAPETAGRPTDTANIAVDQAPPTNSTPSNLAQAINALNGTNRLQENRQALQTEIPSHIHTSGWHHDFGEKVVWLAKNDVQNAQISINPPQLGPLQISISLNGDQASAVFTSAHAEVRQIIQDGMPQLREMLASSGINLGEANVGAQNPQQPRDNNPGQFANGARSSGENAILPADSSVGPTPNASLLNRGRGLVDLFA